MIWFCGISSWAGIILDDFVYVRGRGIHPEAGGSLWPSGWSRPNIVWLWSTSKPFIWGFLLHGPFFRNRPRGLRPDPILAAVALLLGFFVTGFFPVSQRRNEITIKNEYGIYTSFFFALTSMIAVIVTIASDQALPCTSRRWTTKQIYTPFGFVHVDTFLEINSRQLLRRRWTVGRRITLQTLIYILFVTADSSCGRVFLILCIKTEI